ncbi:MAG: M20/M25/M40 family metallo-hydrolase, partial [Rhodospirillales bacterium]|nr:M20/M25/M40 family metallo-hydrolase [Rhodospirillales bacterium]
RDEGPHDAMFEVPYPTVNVGPVNGGISIATVADECTFNYDIRGQMGTDFDGFLADVQAYAFESVRPMMREQAPDCDISFAFHTEYPAFEIAADHDLVRMAATVRPQSDIIKMSGGTEAGLFASIAGIPTIIIGPGSVAQAHQPDEFVGIDQLAASADFVQKFIARSVVT